MQNIQTYIEHTNLNPLITVAEVEKLIAEAIHYQFAGICLPPYWVKKAKRDLGSVPISLVTVVGFPLGYQRSEVKLQEIKSAIRDGANELDVVINLSAVKNAAYDWIKIEVAQFAKLIHENEGILKIILETAYLTEGEIIKSSKICLAAGTDYIKTSTGFAPEGAKIEHIKLLREILPTSVGIKASGGISNYEQVLAFIEAGAERIGTSSGLKIMEEAKVLSTN